MLNFFISFDNLQAPKKQTQEEERSIHKGISDDFEVDFNNLISCLTKLKSSVAFLVSSFLYLFLKCKEKKLSLSFAPWSSKFWLIVLCCWTSGCLEYQLTLTQWQHSNQLNYFYKGKKSYEYRFD